MGVKLVLPYLSPEMDRHGNARLYVRRYGRRIRMKESPGSPAFAAAYTAALDELAQPKPLDSRPRPQRDPAGTLGWLAQRYFGSDEFKTFDPQYQATRRGVIEECLDEPHTESDPEPMRHCPLKYFSSKKVKRLRDIKARAGLPGAANNRRKYLSAMFGWAIEAEIEGVTSNPCRDVRRKKYETSGFYTWKLDDIRQFSEYHPVGSKAMLALALFLFLGVRRSDMVRLGPKMVAETANDDGSIRRAIKFTVRKTRVSRPIETEKPVLPELWQIIEASPCGTATFLETEYGQPFSAKGFGERMRKWCDEAGLPQCTSHGVRKIAATICADGGATVHHLMSIFDWVTIKQAEAYTREADRRRLAQSSMHLLAAPFTLTSGGLH